MSIGPSSSSAACAAASTWSASATSVGRTRALAPSSSISVAAPSSPASPRARSAILAPSCANRRAVARPIPPEAPVMTTTSSMLSIFRPAGEAKPSLPLEHLHGIAVAQLVLPPDLLAREPSRRPPDPGAGTAFTQLVVDRVGDVEHGGRRLQRDWVATVTQMNADEARHGPELLTQPVEARVVEDGHCQDAQLVVLGQRRLV